MSEETEETEETTPTRRVRKKATKKADTPAVSQNGDKPGFIGFEDPPEAPEPDGATWKTRLPVLRDFYPGAWAKYGPFSSTMVKSSATTCRKNADNLGVNVETDIRVEGEEGFLYVRALA